VFERDPVPKVTKITVLAKETYGIINIILTSDEVINMWKLEAGGFKFVNPELPHLSG
jgi:hypothetical protein